MWSGSTAAVRFDERISKSPPVLGAVLMGFGPIGIKIDKAAVEALSTGITDATAGRQSEEMGK